MKTRIFSLLVLFLASLTMQAQIDRSVQPKPGPAPKINIGKPTTFTLKNGLTVMIVENHKLPRVSATLTIDNPLIVEGKKAGVTSLVSTMLGSGSTSISKDDFNEEVDYLGASLNFGSQSASARSLTKYFPKIMELMADAALNPNFTEEDLEAERAKILENLKSEKKSVTAIAGRVQSVLAYGIDHPYGEFITEETINNVTLDDVKNFHKTYFKPNNAYLIIIGDVKTKDVKKLAKKLFNKWEKGNIVADTFSTANNPMNTQVNFINMENAVQSELSVQNTVTLTMKDDDYFPVLIANNILGGGGEARLFNNLREDKKFTYGSYSSIGNNKKTISTFKATASVRNAVTDSAIVEILKEIKNISTELVSAEELKNAKAKYVGNFVMGIERPSTVATYALRIKTEDLPDNFYETYLEKIEAVSREDVLRAAKKYFQNNNLRIVVTGKGSEVIDALENLTFEGKKIPVKYFDQSGAPTEKPEFKKEIPAGVTAQTVIDNYIKAIGGKEKIEAVKTLIVKYEAEAMGSKIVLEEKRTADKYAQVVSMNGNPMMTIVGKKDELFMKQGANKMALPENMLKDMKSSFGIFPELTHLSLGIATLAGIETIDGVDVYKINIPGEVVSVSNYYDVKTGLKIKEVTVTNIEGKMQTQETTFSDYKDQKGIMFPTKKLGSLGPQIVESKLLEVIYNQEIPASDFE